MLPAGQCADGSDWTWLAVALDSKMPQDAVIGPADACDDVAAPSPHGPQLALVLLNTPLPPSRLDRVWEMASFRICADGGANRLRELRPDLVPDVVVGDMDSATEETLSHYRAKGVRVVDLHEDQDTTDFEKALAVAEQNGCGRVIALGAHGAWDGRLDQTFGMCNALMMHPTMSVAVAGADNYFCLFRSGRNVIKVANFSRAPHCGLVPLGKPCASITTEGLEYNMNSQRMEFGGLVSSCNRVAVSGNGCVCVETSDDVLWMCVC